MTNCIIRKKRGAQRAKYHVVFEDGMDWGRRAFVLCGNEFEGFGTSLGKRETKVHAVERLIESKINDINREIMDLEKRKYELIGILDDYKSK